MHARRRPVSVSVDPVSLVISECISITTTIQKHAHSPHSSVSAILGGSPSQVPIARPSLAAHSQDTSITLDNEDTIEPGPTNRWGLRGKRGKSIQDHPLMAGFGRLRLELASIRDIHAFDALSLLNPFLLVLQSKRTAAPVTILTLSALRKFLAYGFVCPSSPRFNLAMQALTAAVTRCQFDTSDPGQVEVVLLMILHLMEDMMSGPGGNMLSDESVCDMMGRGLAICSQPRFSPVLRRTAEAVMVRMCQIIFEDVKHLAEVEGETNPDALVSDTNGGIGSVMINLGPAGSIGGSHSAAKVDAPTARQTTDARGHENDEARADFSDKSSMEIEGGIGDDDAQSLDLRPYSLPTVRELFRVLVNFLNPDDRQHTDTMRVMALRIIHVALEVSGPLITRHPTLALIAEDQLCCYLFQLVRSDNMAILHESLIVAGTLLATCRSVLKLQQELFLSYLVVCLHSSVEIPREPAIEPALYAGIPQAPKLARKPSSQANSGRSTPVPVKDRQKLGLEGGARKPDARQAMVETVGVLSRIPTFMTELFVNYDCDPDRADLCEDLIGLLSRNALPDSATWSTTSVPPLCLDALLRYIQFMAERLDQERVPENYPDVVNLREQRRRKRIIIKGAEKFNDNAKEGLQYLQAQGIIEDIQNPVLVAKFLRGTSRVNKKKLGEYLSKKGSESVLEAYMDTFNFTDKRADEALRSLLETFRLPGESPLIARIVTSFADRYCTKAAPAEVANKDAAFVLTYAIIMLNTDQHNPNVKSSKRMSLEDFSRNLRGVNDGGDFSPEYLEKIYNSIKTNEIILPDEHDNKHAFDYAWRELLMKSESAGPILLCNTNIYDADMFTTTWRPIVSTLSYVFMSATDDAVFARVVTGFDECARIATKYGNTEALDQIVYSLSHMTTIATETASNTSLNTEVQAGDNSVMVSELAVKLGRDFRAQLALLVLFRVVTGSEGLLRKGWQYVIRIWLNLFVNSLIPPYFSTASPLTVITSIPLQTPSQVIDRASKTADTSFFSAFTSYISSYAADEPPEPSDEELESTLCTVDCVNSCDMGVVFANIAKIGTEDLGPLVDALLATLPSEQNATMITLKPEAVSSAPQRDLGEHDNYYDPTLLFALEFVTSLALRDNDTIGSFGAKVVEALQVILRDANQHHIVTVSRATYYLFCLLRASYQAHDYINVPVLLHSIASFSEDSLSKSSMLVVQGLKACIDDPGPLRHEIMTSPDFWVIMRALASRYEAASVVFELLERACTGVPPTIMANNYEAAILLLGEFSSAAGHAMLAERRKAQKHHISDEGELQRANETMSRGVQGVATMYKMTTRIPELMEQSHLESGEAWSAYWLPILSALAMHCTNPCRDVRLLAFTSLQRSLLSPSVTCRDHREWTAIFSEVLFPLVHKLLKPEVFSSDRDGMGEIRVQAVSLLCKVFLRYLVLLSAWDGMLDLWVKIIEIMDRLMNSGQADSLEDAVRENLKNVILFMASNGYMVSRGEGVDKKLVWDETWKRIDRFMPDLKGDMVLDEPRTGDDQVSLKPELSPSDQIHRTC
ncbi:Sec7 domain-containing protein [Sodiomyces alkalinus F11]|uniref:Sec7 domain-containing protein n=1 Tax=Sodiomyces alkalinus (strain CBS 110278 / VKM F-3762 / F11) TaxID=1314773 RepID=A0A3N2PJY0_SODAK|nr:Sec7 domain-containing protein [Sodiomyces alkalinus F11]ROT34831.1 Sec7 domain-containing protein [Sodiomyces alkalinus F11]